MEIEAKPEFSRWANSYSGCDGGNVSGSIWFCGIEFGGGDTEENLNLDPVIQPPYVDDTYRGKFKTYQYNWKLLKLYSAILGRPPSAYKTVYVETQAFHKSSDTFKMNLYPIGFHNESSDLWVKWHYEKTGFPSKSLYQAWCQLSRFGVIRKWVSENNPKAIVCTGSTYIREFFMAFAGYSEVFSTFNTKKLDGGNLIWRKINAGRTVLFVTPFLGQGGLKSDAQLGEFGVNIKSICDDQLFNDWCQYQHSNA